MDGRSRSAASPSRTGRSWRSTSWPTGSAWPSSTWRFWKTDHRTTEGKERTMRVFVAGATGAIGTRLVPKLVERGHEVIGTSRSMDRAQRLHAMGAEPVALDLLDPRAVRGDSTDTTRGDAVRARKSPSVGKGQGVSSSTHLADAPAAPVLALEHEGPAIYNVADDEPAAIKVWRPELARILGAKPPRH